MSKWLAEEGGQQFLGFPGAVPFETWVDLISAGPALRTILGFECELLDRQPFPTQVEARIAVFDFIGGWYNTHRRHSALDYASPIGYERRHATALSTSVARDCFVGAPYSDDLHESEARGWSPESAFLEVNRITHTRIA